MKIAASAGALALIALVPTPAEAQTAAYAVEASQESYNVSCRAGASSGTAPIRLRVTNDDTTATRWVATWPGGSTTITREDRFFQASKDATIPCPTEQSANGQFTITVQAFDAQGVAVGAPITTRVGVRRVGSASGPVAVGADGAPLVSEVLGLRLGAPDGPAPEGGVQTGAGGTSQPANNLLLPLGAGIGFAGLAAAIMIRRRRSPAV